MYLEDQISILEWFLKDHVTLKSGVMMQKIQVCPHRIWNQRSYLKYDSLFDQIHAALVSKRDVFQKHF